ncbi:MAG: maleylpyruvate isomerase N-terminal domain-containing protein [Nocardioides sp.]
MSLLAVAYLEAARSAAGLLERPEVADAWDRPSALEGMTVGALAVHLASEVLLVQNAWRDPARWSQDEPIPLLEHYRRSTWVTGGPDHEANVGIRESAERAASPGHAAMLADVRVALADLEGLREGTEQPEAVQMGWWAWSLSWGDFLVTRMMEIVVHSDDLAVSADVEPPELPGAVLEPVLSLLVGVATMRHGQAAVVRALSRSERAPASIAAF